MGCVRCPLVYLLDLHIFSAQEILCIDHSDTLINMQVKGHEQLIASMSDLQDFSGFFILYGDCLKTSNVLEPEHRIID